MGEAFIVRRGGPGQFSLTNALLHIRAPAGSTITLSKGGVTAASLAADKGHANAADSSLADWYYAVSPSNYGEWTVTATLGSETSAETVTVNANSQYDLLLSYNLYLIRSGVLLTQAHTPYSSTTNVLYEQSGSYYHVQNLTIDPSFDELTISFGPLPACDYPLLVGDFARVDLPEGSSYPVGVNLRVGVQDSNYVDKTSLAGTQLEVEDANPFVMSVDVSSVTLEGKYVKLTLHYQKRGIYIRNLYLTRTAP